MAIPTELKKAAERVYDGVEEAVTVRTLLGWFGMQRRGYNNAATVQRSLRSLGLVTAPPFEQAWIDARVKLRPTPPEVAPIATETERRWLDQVVAEMREPDAVVDAAPPVTDTTPLDPQPEARGEPTPSVQVTTLDVEHRLGMLDSANLGAALATVGPDEPIRRVITLMSIRDFSQIPVMRTRGHCLGIVTWRSIGRFVSAHGDLPTRASECVEPVHSYAATRNLFDVVREVLATGCVLVQPPNSTLPSGIVTLSDLASLFGERLEPFVLAGEIEAGLRGAMASIPMSEDGGERAERTIGSMLFELSAPAVWSALGWSVDREVFLNALNDVRVVRNDLMHFTPDPFDADEIDRLRRFACFLREMLRSSPGAGSTPTAACAERV